MKGPYYHFRKVFSEVECEQLKNYALQFPLQDATVGYGKTAKVNEAHRKAGVVWLNPQDVEVKPIVNELILCALEANKECFWMQLFSEPRLSYERPQFTQYSVGDKFDWHEDNNIFAKHESDRKLSLVVQLSHSASYEGGKLELDEHPILENHFSKLGDVIIFPSFLRHRVTEITSGTRHSLVMWFLGPQLS